MKENKLNVELERDCRLRTCRFNQDDFHLSLMDVHLNAPCDWLAINLTSIFWVVISFSLFLPQSRYLWIECRKSGRTAVVPFI